MVACRVRYDHVVAAWDRMRRIAPWWWAAAAAALAYAPALAGGLVFDDLVLYAGNGYFTDPASFGALVGPSYWASGELTWRPVATFAHLCDTVPIGAPSPALAHGVNVALHALAAALVAALAHALVGGFAAPLAAGLAMAWHPGPSEAVIVVTYREDLLAACGMLGAALLALSVWRGRRSGWSAAGSLACGALALGAKETALCLAPLLAALAWHAARAGCGRRVAALVGGHALLAVAYAALRFGPLRHPEEADAAFPLPPGLVPRLATGLRVLGEDLRLLGMPWSLSADPWPPTVASLWDVRLAWPLVLVGSVVAAIVALRRLRLVAGGLLAMLWLLAPTLPWSGIANLRADRFVYLPLAAVAIALAGGWRAVAVRWPDRRRWLAAGGAALALAALLRLESRIPDFADDVRLWAATLAADPTSVRARLQVGHRLVQDGRVDDGLALMREGVALRPEHVHGHQRLGETLLPLAAERRDPALRDEAARAFRAAIERKPHWALLYARLGDLARAFGDTDAAMAHYRDGLAREPEHPDIAGALGTLLAARGQRDEALRLLEVAVAGGVDTLDVLWNCAELRRAAGDAAGARALYERVAPRPDAPPQVRERLEPRRP